MSTVSRWVLSISGVVLVGVLIEILLPKGKMNKILRSIISLSTLIVILAPLKDVKALSIPNLLEKFSSITINQDFLNKREEDYLKEIEKQIDFSLQSNGYKGTKTKIKGKIIKGKLEIKNVFVDLKKLVLESENLNINKYTNIVAIVKKTINVKEENIIFYE